MSLVRLPNKRDSGIVGSELVVTYHTDLVACEIVPSGRRYTYNGNFKAGTFLTFNGPTAITDSYPNLLSSEDGEADGVPLILSTFTTDVKADTLQDEWEGEWFVITAGVCPNLLTFEGVEEDGWEEDSDKPKAVRYAVALPRDDGIVPITPRYLSNTDDNIPWPIKPAQASFAGPVDLEAYHLRNDAWTDQLRHSSIFIKLGSYIIPENDRLPRKGVHVYHVLVLFPVNQQPWSGMLRWMRTTKTPFYEGSSISRTGRVLGVLNRKLLQEAAAELPVRILVVVADNWEFIRQASLTAPTTARRGSAVRGATTPLKDQASTRDLRSVKSRNSFYSALKGKGKAHHLYKELLSLIPSTLVPSYLCK